MTAVAARILVVGVGNILHGDDGFGIELAHRLQARTDLPRGVRVVETGIGGIGMVHEAMSGYRALLVLDAYARGGAPGSLYWLDPELPDLQTLDVHQHRAFFADTHYATPIRALCLLRGLGHLPPLVKILGCEPGSLDELRLGLSPLVAAAVIQAESIVVRWIDAVMSKLEPSPVAVSQARIG